MNALTGPANGYNRPCRPDETISAGHDNTVSWREPKRGCGPGMTAGNRDTGHTFKKSLADHATQEVQKGTTRALSSAVAVRPKPECAYITRAQAN